MTWLTNFGMEFDFLLFAAGVMAAWHSERWAAVTDVFGRSAHLSGEADEALGASAHYSPRIVISVCQLTGFTTLSLPVHVV